MATHESATALAFWDLAELWALERAAPVPRAAAELARGAVFEGLVVNSIEVPHLDLVSGALEFRGDPFVGYRATPEGPLLILRQAALRHLIAVARDGAAPRRAALSQEQVTQRHFLAWLAVTGRRRPRFWSRSARAWRL